MKKTAVIYFLIFTVTIILNSSMYEFGFIKPRYVISLNKITDSLRTERLTFISEITDLKDYLKAHNNSFSSDIEKSEVLKKIYLLEKDILIKAKSVEDMKLVMDKILINSPNLRKFPVIFPVKPSESRISSTFGKRVSPRKGASSNHKGIDYASALGTKVYAPADGIVTIAATNIRGYGTMIRVKHSFGFETIFGHLSKYNVHVGDSVRIGQIIANVGSTGVSTGPHLHYEILKNGVNLNPISFTEVMENKFNK